MISYFFFFSVDFFAIVCGGRGNERESKGNTQGKHNHRSVGRITLRIQEAALMLLYFSCMVILIVQQYINDTSFFSARLCL